MYTVSAALKFITVTMKLFRITDYDRGFDPVVPVIPHHTLGIIISTVNFFALPDFTKPSAFESCASVKIFLQSLFIYIYLLPSVT